MPLLDACTEIFYFQEKLYLLLQSYKDKTKKLQMIELMK